MTRRGECATSTGYEFLPTELRTAAQAWDTTLGRLDPETLMEVSELVAAVDEGALSACSLGLRIASLSLEDQSTINSLLREKRSQVAGTVVIREVLHA